jgi:UTP--glucose-1-phosphate uridylyltransferase
LLGDTLVESGEPVTKQLVGTFERYQESVIALEEVPMERISRYGVIDGQQISDDIFLVRDFVEKPDVNDAPSNLAIAGRYILTPGIFEKIEKTVPGKNDEIQLTDAMRSLLSSRAIYGLRFSGRRFAVGNRLDFIKTNVTMALKRPELRENVESYILELAESLK